MRYGIIPDSLPERIALAAGKIPVPVVDSLIPLLQTRALMAGARLGVFDAIGRRARSAGEIAADCHLAAEPVDMLLRVLMSARYVTREGAAYRLSPLGLRTLLPDGPDTLRGYIEFNYVQWDLVGHLEQLLERGRGLDLHGTLTDEGPWQLYQRGMLELARLNGPLLAKMVPVKKGATRMLDLAGSHGFLGASICRRHPGLRSTVLDLPAALPHARALAREMGIADVVEHREANLLVDPLDSGMDLILLANILHHFTPDQNAGLLRRARAALTPGGTIAIWDFERRLPGARPELVGDALALYFALTSGSEVASGRDYTSWLEAAGFVRVRLKRAIQAPVNVLAIGINPGRSA